MLCTWALLERRKSAGLPGVVTHCQGSHPGRTGGLWLLRTLVLSGFHAVVVPSGFRTRVHPQRWIAI